MKLTLAKKLIIGGVVLVLVPLLVLGWYALDRASRGLNEAALGNAGNTAKRVADMVELYLQGEVKIAQSLAIDHTSVDALKASAQTGIGAAKQKIEELSETLGGFSKAVGKDYEAVIVIDKSGKVIAGNLGGKLRGIDLSERKYFKQAISGKTNAGDVVLSKNSGLPVTVVATPVKDNSGSILGVTALVVDLKYLSGKVTGFKVGETGYAWLVNDKGYFVMHPNSEVLLKEHIDNLRGMEEVSRQMLAGRTGVSSYVYKGVSKICGYAPVPLTGWSLAVTQNEDEFMAAVESIQYGIALIAGLALLGAIGLIMLFSRSITKPIEQVAQGLDMASSQVSAAATQVAASSQQLAEGASEQAASLEETTSALEELSSMTQQNSDNAQQANLLSQETGKIVDRAGAIMHDFNQSMSEITQATQQTAGIIKTIDEIAFQTNLLALNAAVEAARAGEAGAGFAVVAEEVRNLAMRSATAAKETAGLIESTVSKVASGSDLVEKSDQAFKEVAESTHKVTELLSEIAAASSEQSQGIGQINLAISTMDKVTQGSAATAEETASASEEMNGQAEGLHDFVVNLVKVVKGKSGTSQAVPQIELNNSWRSKTNPKRRAPNQAAKAIPFNKEEATAGPEDFTDF
jgi:methyl-accepting chemotaxis protein